MKRRTMLATAVALAAGLFAAPAFAAFPDKPVNVICPWTAGGGTDVSARMFEPYLKKYLGTTVGVVNKPGGNGEVGFSAIGQGPFFESLHFLGSPHSSTLFPSFCLPCI